MLVQNLQVDFSKRLASLHNTGATAQGTNQFRAVASQDTHFMDTFYLIPRGLKVPSI